MGDARGSISPIAYASARPHWSRAEELVGVELRRQGDPTGARNASVQGTASCKPRFFFSSRRRHTRCSRDWSSDGALPILLDTALARSPVDRCQSAAKLAHDLAAVAGLSGAAGGAALPAMLTDGEDKTELIEPVQARKRSRVPIVVGVIVVLGAAGAVVTIGLPVKQTGGVPPADTARQIAPSPAPVDTVTGGAVVPPRRGPVGRSRAPATGPRIDVTRARDVLDDLLLNKLDPRSAALVRDSAMHIFYAPGIASSDKAYAAFVVGNAYFQQFNRRRWCEC